MWGSSTPENRDEVFTRFMAEVMQEAQRFEADFKEIIGTGSGAQGAVILAMTKLLGEHIRQLPNPDDHKAVVAAWLDYWIRQPTMTPADIKTFLQTITGLMAKALEGRHRNV